MKWPWQKYKIGYIYTYISTEDKKEHTMFYEKKDRYEGISGVYNACKQIGPKLLIITDEKYTNKYLEKKWFQ